MSSLAAQMEVSPDALLLASGGSAVEAMRITGDVLRKLKENGAVKPQAGWIAFVIDRFDCAGEIEWDPQMPIPEGTILLRCFGWGETSVGES